MIFLVRHGAVENPQKLRYGRLPGFVLSSLGRRQAAAAGDHLGAQGLRSPLVLTSPLERAVETAEIVSARLGLETPPRVDPRLIEVGSRYDGLPWVFSPSLYWARRRDTTHPHRDEPMLDVALRFTAALGDALREHDGDLIVVSHQLPIRAALLALTHGSQALRSLLPGPLLLRLRQPLDPVYACVIALAPARDERWSVTSVTPPP